MITTSVTIRFLVSLSVACACTLGSVANADPDVDAKKVAQVKSAFLLNFLKFTDWPKKTFANEETPIIVGVIGEQPEQKILDQSLAKGKAHNRTIELQYFDIPDPKKEPDQEAFDSQLADLKKSLAACQLVYITEAETAAYKESLPDLVVNQTLLVSDNADLLQEGVHLAFEIDKGHVVFKAALETIKEMAYKLSSKLLRLARPVDKDK